jgi:predicted nuclease with TOPRIM domain
MMADLIAHARAIADDSMGMEVGDRECVAQLIDRIEELEAELKATQDNEQRLVDANKPLLARACKAEADNERLRAVYEEIMARLADLLESDQFNNIEALVLNAGVDYPELTAVKEAGDE